MSQAFAEKFENVSVVTKANVYFDGKVVSHTVLLAGGEKRTVGLIYPGTYHFNTGAPERMEIIDGNCRAKLPGDDKWQSFPAGTSFDVPGNSGFDIAVDEGIAQYICSFLS